MSKTKVIEVFERTQLIVQIGTDTKDRVTTVAITADDLKELNSDYINEHYGSLQDEAYQKGYDKGYTDKTNNDEVSNKLAKDIQDEAYQRGLDDAWEAAKKISLMPPDEIEKVFPGAAKYNRYNLGYSGVEAIERLKAYEEKQKADEDVKRGDILRNKTNGLTYIVTLASDYGYVLLGNDGNCATTCITNTFEKTGKHFDIDKILDEMKK